MDVQKYLEEKKELQNILISFIDDDTGDENYFSDFEEFIKSKNVTQNWSDFQELLSLLSAITFNHHKHGDFLEKIEKILLVIKKYSNDLNTAQKQEIFEIFKSNRQFLILIFKAKIIFFEQPFKQEDEELIQYIFRGVDQNDVPYHYYLYNLINPIEGKFSVIFSVLLQYDDKNEEEKKK